ncbi:MAG: pyridoxal-phosphate dependent enzyme [Acidobacteriota bacterium]
MTAPVSSLTHLSCTACDRREEPETRGATCADCGGLLACQYEEASGPPERSSGRRDVFAWATRLPVRDAERRRGLSEADTPLLPLPHLAEELGLAELHVKDDGATAAGTCARGLVVAAAAQAERGATGLALASAGPGATACARLARAHELPARLILPSAATPGFRLEGRLLKTRVVAVLGDQGVAQTWLLDHPGPAGEGEADLTPGHEPFAVEGLKTLAYELVAELGSAPDALVLPTGSGLGLVGAARGFDELGGTRPLLLAAQTEGCAPLARAFVDGAETCTAWEPSRRTLAEGLRQPNPTMGRAALATLRAGEGEVATASESELIAALRRAAKSDGVLLGADGAIGLACLEKLSATERLKDRRVVLWNPTSLLRSPETMEAAGVG